MKTPVQFFALAAGCALGGCASPAIDARQQEKFRVFSEPRGAHIELSNGTTGTTPAYFVIPRDGDLNVTISKDGYESVLISVHSSKKINQAAAAVGLPLVAVLNPIEGVLFLAELASGETPLAAHRPNPVKVKLKPLAPAASGSVRPAGRQDPRLTSGGETLPTAF